MQEQNGQNKANKTKENTSVSYGWCIVIQNLIIARVIRIAILFDRPFLKLECMYKKFDCYSSLVEIILLPSLTEFH